MPGASKAIVLLLFGTGLSGSAYVASQHNGVNYDDDSSPSTQPSNWSSGNNGYSSHGSSHYYGHSYFSGDDDSGSSHSFSGSTERGGFGSTGHAHASASS